MKTFTRPQEPSSSFNEYNPQKRTFKNNANTSFDMDEVRTVINTVKGTYKFNSPSTDNVSYEIRVEGYTGKEKGIISISFFIEYLDSRFGLRNGSLDYRNEKISENQFEITDATSFYLALFHKRSNCNYRETEPLNFLIEIFKENFFKKQHIQNLEDKKKQLTTESMFDFSNKTNSSLADIEAQIFEHKKFEAKKNENKILKYIKNNKLIVSFDFIVGTAIWFFVYYLLSSFEHLSFDYEGYEHFIAYYLKFMMMQHWYSIPFFWASGFIARKSFLNHIKTITKKPYFNSLDELEQNQNKRR